MKNASMLLGAVMTAVICAAAVPLGGGEPPARGAVAQTWEEARDRMTPWRGARRAGADPATLEGKVMAGYQGWFAAEGDGSGMGWIHYGTSTRDFGKPTIEAWPDMTETTPAERYPAPFKFKDGTGAALFSSYHPATVDRHFRWMAEHGIDGVFLQRFVAYLRDPRTYDWRTGVTDNVRAAANAHGRTWAMMYDLSGMEPDKGDVERVIEDWKRCVDRMAILRDPGYQRHQGKPLVALWGVGLNDGRKYNEADVARLMEFFQHDKKYGGNAVMLGVAFWWRTGGHDAVPTPALQELCAKADVLSPWAVGRYNSPEDYRRRILPVQTADLQWCREKIVAYLPVIFPGFRWENLMRARGQNPGNPIPRGDGTFYWTQGRELIAAGATMLYLAMFDEVDEGTAIFKITNEPPGPDGAFMTNEGQPPDHYLWLSGQLGGALKKKTVPSQELPKRGK